MLICPLSAVFVILHWCISWSWPESFHDTNTAPCVKQWALFIVTGCSLCFFLFLCYAHRFIYKWKYSSDYPLQPTADELCTLFNWLCVSFNSLTAWSAGSVGPSKVSFDLALCLVSCFTPWACGLLQDSFPHLLPLCLERTQVHFHMYYFTDCYDHRRRGNQLFHYNVHHCSSALQSCQ